MKWYFLVELFLLIIAFLVGSFLGSCGGGAGEPIRGSTDQARQTDPKDQTQCLKYPGPCKVVSGASVSTYEYEKNGRAAIVSTTQEEGNISRTEVEYDDNGNCVSTVAEDNNGVFTNTRKFNENSDLILDEAVSKIKLNGKSTRQVIRWEYDYLDKERWKERREYILNDDGQFELSRKYSYVYDSENRVSVETEERVDEHLTDFKRTYTYSVHGNREKVVTHTVGLSSDMIGKQEGAKEEPAIVYSSYSERIGTEENQRIEQRSYDKDMVLKLSSLFLFDSCGNLLEVRIDNNGDTEYEEVVEYDYECWKEDVH